jgi:hypothetical protein
MRLSQDLRKIFKNTKLLLHPDDYTIINVDPIETHQVRQVLPSFSPFSSVTFDSAEISLVVKSDEWREVKESFKSHREEGPYRLITFDIVLDLSIVGFLAVVSDVLAQEGISIYALSTYLRDHILVKREDSKRAVNVLMILVETASTRQDPKN